MKYIRLYKKKIDFEVEKSDFQNFKHWITYTKSDKEIDYSGDFDNSYEKYNIYYSTIDDNVVNTENIDCISNTYINGTGIITFENPITSIGEYAFSNCNNLQTIVIPNGTTEIKDYAFYNCANLKTIVIPSSVSKIKDNAFSECPNINPDIIYDINDVTDDTTGGNSREDCLDAYSISAAHSHISDECEWYTTTYMLKTIGYFLDEEEDISMPLKMDINISGEDITYSGSMLWHGIPIYYNIIQHSVDVSRISYEDRNPIGSTVIYLNPNQTGNVYKKFSYVAYLDEIIPLKTYTFMEKFDATTFISTLNKFSNAYEPHKFEFSHGSIGGFPIQFCLLDFDEIEYKNTETTIDYKTPRITIIYSVVYKNNGSEVLSHSRRKILFIGYNTTNENRIIEVTIDDGNENLIYTITQTPNTNNDLLVSTIVTYTNNTYCCDYVNPLLEDDNSIIMSGNALFFNRLMSNHIMNRKPEDGRIIKYDNYGFGIYKTYPNGWVGGKEIASTYNAIFNISLEDTNKTITLNSAVDENNTIFFNECFTNIVIRVPYNGMSFNIDINKYPFNFISEHYYNLYNILDDISVYITKNKVYKEDGLIKLMESYTEVSDMIANIKLQGKENDILTDSLSFDIIENNTDEYKELYTINKDISLNIIQESPSERRIYYGCINNPELCNSIYGKDGDYFTFFALNNSEIVNNKAFYVSTYNNLRGMYLIAIPKKIFKNISLVSSVEESDLSTYITLDTKPILFNDSFFWGNQEYVLYKAKASKQTIINVELL